MSDSHRSRFDLTGKVALVTGGTRGIGRAIAFEFARAGAHVVVSSRKADAVTSTASALRADGGAATGVPANVGRPGEVATLLETTLAAAGGLDILVNNAATNPVYGPITDVNDEAFDKIMAVNVKAPWDLARRALPHMVARGGGSVINISSIGGLSPEPNLGIYSVSKAALVMLTRTMAREWGPQGVRANVICPGFIKTDFSAALWKNEAIAAHVIAETPIARIGEPEDVSGLALFLASDAAAYCTGGVYMADGGYLA
jgi:dehydrogenase/reductase SDR family protein 4